MTHPTAKFKTSYKPTRSNPGTGLSFPRTRGNKGSAVSPAPHDGSTENGDRQTNISQIGYTNQGTSAPRDNQSHGTPASNQGTSAHADNQYHSTPASTTNTQPNSSSTSNTHENNSRRPTKQKIKKNTRAAIKIATLNMRGKDTEKWYNINQNMRDKKIGILALQETHLTDELKDQLHKIFGKRLEIINTIDPEQPNARGVAIVLNKEITNTQNIKSTVLISSRAILISIPWHLDQILNILAIYVPNSHSDNEKFWNNIISIWESKNLPKPDIVLGDFNLVEDAIDRIPSHLDNGNAVEALCNLKNKFKIVDGWRHNYPNSKAYTFLQQATGIQSRIDRIYVTENIMKNSFEWNIETSGILTDHKMVSTKITSPKTPYIGKGRWTMPLTLLKNKHMMNKIQEKTLELEAELNSNTMLRTNTYNLQTLWKSLKNEIINIARNQAKITIPKLEKEIKDLEEKLKLIQNDPNADEPSKMLDSLQIEEEITFLEKKRHQNIRINTEVRNKLEGETISKYWSQINKEKAPRDTINFIKIPQSNPPKYETNSQKMANLAKEYHDSLQSTDNPSTQEDYEQKIQDILNKMSPISTNMDTLNRPLQNSEIEQALKSSPNGKAAGLDGIPTELWKQMHEQYRKKGENQNKVAN